jgi:hypothetical protein
MATLTGRAYIAARLKITAEAFPSGPPNLAAIVEGSDTILDPRTGATGWSDKPGTLLGDNGYFSAANVTACQAAGIDPLIALGRERHYPTLEERFAAPPPTPNDPTLVEAMAHRLQTPEGRTLYVQRKHMPEPVFGIIKSVLRFRQFLLRGLDAVRGAASGAW